MTFAFLGEVFPEETRAALMGVAQGTIEDGTGGLTFLEVATSRGESRVEVLVSDFHDRERLATASEEKSKRTYEYPNATCNDEAEYGSLSPSGVSV